MNSKVPMYGFGGGGGTGATLTVTAPSGCTVTVSKDGKTKTKTAGADGVAVFRGLATGQWTVNMTDGVQTAPAKTADITADYAITMAFFSATIHVTYPAGSTCTATDGTTTLTAPDTSGTWDCVVPNAGTWTVRITNGTYTKDSDPIAITSDGQRESVSLSYAYYLFKAGSGSVVSLKTYKESNATITVRTDEITTTYSDSTYNATTLRTESKIDLTQYKTLCMECTISAVADSNYAVLGVTATAFTSAGIEESTFSSKVSLTKSTVSKVFSVDLSAISTSLYVGFLFSGKMNVTNIWLE